MSAIFASGPGSPVTSGVVGAEVGISRAAMYQKLKCSTPFKASEVAALADLLVGHSKPETTARYVALPADALRAAVLGAA